MLNEKSLSRLRAAAVRAEMSRRGLKVGGLALRIGVDPEYLTNVICGNGKSPRVRGLIEQALSIVVWSGVYGEAPRATDSGGLKKRK